jgi:hypothetical protein
MLRGYWLSIIKAAGLSLLLFAVYALFSTLSWHSTSLENEAAQRAKIHGQNAENRIERVCYSPLAKPDCVDEARQAQRENEREEQDLAAQKVTAWWTKVMGLAALIGMALSAVGVWLVKTTFDETRRNNEISKYAFHPNLDIIISEDYPRENSITPISNKYNLSIRVKNNGSATINIVSVSIQAGFPQEHEIIPLDETKVVEMSIIPGGDRPVSFNTSAINPQKSLVNAERDEKAIGIVTIEFDAPLWGRQIVEYGLEGKLRPFIDKVYPDPQGPSVDLHYVRYFLSPALIEKTKLQIPANKQQTRQDQLNHSGHLSGFL